jgi:hypothetical protein
MVSLYKNGVDAVIGIFGGIIMWCSKIVKNTSFEECHIIFSTDFNWILSGNNIETYGCLVIRQKMICFSFF